MLPLRNKQKVRMAESDAGSIESAGGSSTARVQFALTPTMATDGIINYSKPQ